MLFQIKNTTLTLINAALFFQTVLMFAIDSNNIIMQHQKNKELWNAVYSRQTGDANEALKHGANIESTDNSLVLIRNVRISIYDSKPLHIAAVDDEATTKLLLDYKASIDSCDKDNNTPLMWAAFYGFVPSIKLLINAGASLEFRNKEGETALIRAFKRNKKKAFKLLLERGANPLVEFDDSTLFHQVAMIHDIEFLKILLNFIAPDKVDTYDENNKELACTPLYYAFINNCCLNMALLITKGANANLPYIFNKHKEKETLIHKSLEYKINHKYSSFKLANLLLCPFINYKIKDKEGYTPLEKAYFMKNYLAWLTLIQYEQYIRILYNRGRSLFKEVINQSVRSHSPAIVKNKIRRPRKRRRYNEQIEENKSELKIMYLPVGWLSEDIVQYIVSYINHEEFNDEILLLFVKDYCRKPSCDDMIK